jgi:hypothetical protein
MLQQGQSFHKTQMITALASDTLRPSVTLMRGMKILHVALELTCISVPGKDQIWAQTPHLKKLSWCPGADHELQSYAQAEQHILLILTPTRQTLQHS